MIPTMIFSKDRPMQLDALLRSVRRYAPELLGPLHVIYTQTGVDFATGYAQCQVDHPYCHWHYEAGATQFELRVRRLLADMQFVCFLVDDDLFYRDAPHPGLALPFSFRLDYGRWYWRDYDPYSDEGYPLALDGHIYDVPSLVPLLDFEFANPTQFEAGLDGNRAQFGPQMIYGYRCLVGIPANRVSSSSNMRTTGGPSAEELNRLYLDGKRIDLDETFAGVRVTAAHQDIPYVIR
jgi:hypothetical protein